MTYTHQFETTILNGLPVQIRFDIMHGELFGFTVHKRDGRLAMWAYRRLTHAERREIEQECLDNWPEGLRQAS